SQVQAQVARRQESQPATPAPATVPQIVIVNGQQIVRPALEPATVVTPESLAALTLSDDEVVTVPVVAAADEPLDEPDATPAPMPLVYRNQPAFVTPAVYQQPTPQPQP